MLFSCTHNGNIGRKGLILSMTRIYRRLLIRRSDIVLVLFRPVFYYIRTTSRSFKVTLDLLHHRMRDAIR